MKPSLAITAFAAAVLASTAVHAQPGSGGQGNAGVAPYTEGGRANPRLGRGPTPIPGDPNTVDAPTGDGIVSSGSSATRSGAQPAAGASSGGSGSTTSRPVYDPDTVGTGVGGGATPYATTPRDAIPGAGTAAGSGTSSGRGNSWNDGSSGSTGARPGYDTNSVGTGVGGGATPSATTPPGAIPGRPTGAVPAQPQASVQPGQPMTGVQSYDSLGQRYGGQVIARIDDIPNLDGRDGPGQTRLALLQTSLLNTFSTLGFTAVRDFRKVGERYYAQAMLPTGSWTAVEIDPNAGTISTVR